MLWALLPFLWISLAIYGCMAFAPPSRPLARSSPNNSALLRALAPALSVVLMGSLNARVRRLLRTFTYLAGLGMTSVFGALISVPMALAGRSRNINYWVARTFYRFVGPLVGWSFTVEGEENMYAAQPCVYVSNHQSMIDILYVGRIMPRGASMMAKKELLFAPFLGLFMWLSNAVFVDRANRRDAVATFARVGEKMKKQRTSLWVFVEGTRSGFAKPDLLPFKKGAFHLAVQAQVPLVPVVCENYHRLYQSGKVFAPGQVGIRCLEPIPTTGLTSSQEDIAALIERTRGAMMGALLELARRPGAVSGTAVGEDGEPQKGSTDAVRARKDL